MPPRGRRLERARPQAALGRAGVAFGGGVAAVAVFGGLDGVAGAHHGLAEVAAVGGAERDLAVVAVAFEARAGDGAAFGRRRERARRDAAAAIGPAGAVAADLAAFRRVDAEQADVFAGKRKRIAVEHAGATGHARSRHAQSRQVEAGRARA